MTVLGHSLGMRIVAEGVETREQLIAIAEIGVNQIQGYLIGKPMPGDDLARLALELQARAAARAGSSQAVAEAS
jgi:EAL domain-containing protein (putative c-di-GMP-specific phosphodiesterase class I)